jgi:protease-4
MDSNPNPNTKPRSNPLTLVLGLSAGFFGIFLVVTGAIYLHKTPGSASGGGKSGLFSEGSVGIVEINGVIMDSKKTLKTLERFEEEDEIKAVVVRLNSPGGAVAPSQEIYEAVRNYKKPLLVSMSSIAASGAFYVAMGAKKVFANPGTITGSIGVIMEFANIEKLYEWAKIKRYALKTGKYKDAGAEYREMQPEERALLQGMIDNVLGQFKAAVSKGRKLPLEEVTAIADGRVFSGQQAKALKLVDELGTLQDAVDDAAKLAKIKGTPNVVYPDRSGKRKWLDLLLKDDDKEESRAGDSLIGALVGGNGASLQERLTGLAPGIYWLWAGAR